MRSPVQDYLERLLDELRPQDGGQPHQAIPATADMDPELYGVALTTVDGDSYAAGDTEQAFSLQSISKAFTYAMALEDLGPERVQEKIDVEPSGDPFNEISLQAGTGRPDNPMINAGAIATTSLIKGRGGRDRMGRILNTFSEAAGRELKVSEGVFRSEDRTGHRNRALSWLLRSFGIIESDPEPVVQDYFRQCSVLVTVRDLSVMAATLANQGVNPVTGERVFAPRTVRWVLSVLSTCGMYDDAGTWAIEVGLPSKSGVGGGLLVVVPGQLGIGVFSPSLDAHGTSVRGAATVKRLATDLGLHYGDAPPVGRSVIRASYDLSEAPSGVPRSTEALQVIEAHGAECRIVEIGGDIGFSEAETLARLTTELPESVRTLMVDVSKVDDFGRAAVRILNQVVRLFIADGRDLLLVDDDRRLTETMVESAEGSPYGALPNPFEAEGDREARARDGADDAPAFRLFLSRSLAVEWVEQRLLNRHAPGLLPVGRQDPARSPLLELFTAADARTLADFMETRDYRPGQVIRRAGQPFGGIYFITSGQVELTAQGSGGRRYRQVFLSPGMIFGEIALGQAGRQVTTVRAVGPVTTQVLTAQVISALEESDPRLAIKLWSALARDAYTTVEQMIRETGARSD
ncbi:glutaminase A [Citricoccus sp. SGAir0253]|uniref:glutaminase A n=1 Tax=Citricoccus sp. SGAir0253 TaxID=2567881 RepID=UPI0010CD3DA0|nr:glutaminase A [Citricoccus sp. SGAir0253]QCU78720.1 glutaminase A [Citricoccus sp. SGAir0253]